MKNRFLFFTTLAVLSVSCFMCSFLPGSKENDDKTIVTEKIMAGVLQLGHFSPRNFDDKFSEDVFDLYLKRIDLNKKFLLKSDVEQLKTMRDKIDDQLLNDKLDFFNKSNELLSKRYAEVESFYKDLLKTPFEYDSDEKIETDNKKLDYAKDAKSQKEEWRKLFKYQTLVRIGEAMEEQEKALAKKDTIFEAKTFAQIEKESREKVEKNYTEFFKRLKKVTETDRAGMYLNTIANVFDPHTEFFPPKIKDNFDILMSGQLEGIGAQLQEKDGTIKVSNIVPGSASWRQGELKAGDIILKVAQGNQEPVDITDMRLDDAVLLIRGKKGTEVRLSVKKPDGSVKVISIIRDIVVLDETYAKSLIIDNQEKIGYIKLPSFYADFNKPGGRRCATDVRNEIDKLKKENIKGLILDLRNNGGGSLQDVVEMAGLFIDKGPIVQVKNTGNFIEVLEDKNPGVFYDGPLVVMVNNISASASEIMAAAIQDYNRGVIIGGEQTFGKGTVQRVLNLDDRLSYTQKSFAPIGSLKLTMQKFYRVNGGSTQLKGVESDIVLPDKFEKLYKGEREEDYPMPWDEINPAAITKWSSSFNMDEIKKNSRIRVESNTAFKQIRELEDTYKKQSDNTLVSLKWKTYREEQKKNSTETDSLEKTEKESYQLKAFNLPVDLPVIESDSTKKVMNEDWLKNVKKDTYIKEAVNVLKDMR
ncbi:MAG: carboxy terminal-processing peptidase [Bacteroidia bacterium]|nr:carboxy terminal-processing peptidase [Bacteroidia bacterium]MCZ2249335.1 carboxy terminal-processing peptidase [Bacteroidia bacterium]